MPGRMKRYLHVADLPLIKNYLAEKNCEDGLT
jgi:hypothetical protein